MSADLLMSSGEHTPQVRAYSAEYPLTRRRALPVRTVACRRPGGQPLTYRGSGVRVSRAVHRRHSVSLGVTVIVAVGAAVATMWLLMLGQVSAAGTGSSVPDRVAVVQVAPGETLADVAARVAPGVSQSAVVAKIRELNELDSGTVQAGQTLVSPVG